MSDNAAHPPIALGDHEAYMENAQSRARLSPPAATKFCVGAVLVDAEKNKVLSTGYSLELPGDRHGDPGTTHAEHCCFIKAAEDYGVAEAGLCEVLPKKNTVLYTTMEPCNGRLSGNRTCVDRILALQDAIKTVYVGIKEPGTFLEDNQGQERLEAAGVTVIQLTGMEDRIREVSLAGHHLSQLDALPKHCRVVSTQAHGASFFANTGRIKAELQDGTSQSFFIKVVSGEVGKNMVAGEFEPMKAIRALLPEFVPAPIAHGTYESCPDTHFFLCEFRNMVEEMPDPYKFAAQLAALHQSSKSPTGKFGFHATTYSGNLPQALDFEREAKGPDPDFDSLLPVLFDVVVPRLLRPLESEGRSLKPCLVHGDLWYANSGIDVETGRCLVFDACCFYAHNEYEFGQWMPVCNKFGADYLAAYNSYVQISDPAEDYEGRLDLYKLRFNTHVSALFKDNPNLRDQMLGDIRDLVARYGSQADKIPTIASHNLGR
ncbi:hypothetical protein PG997_015210 [Apiospora hydei]|uniref:protein-ribulosamine 3-kinase n=1 Tax=Apiospora hydei TaxID=1337664 RepID=A0ABR1UW08_9PEZI